MHHLFRKSVRSPHLLEVILSYGTVCFLQSYICVFQFGMGFVRWLALSALGAVVYTFLEYLFHRWLLHHVLHQVHNNHHKRPRNLRIITTPILPVQLYDFLVILLLMCVVGREIAYAINCSISFGQCVMDSVHVLFHSSFRPWYLESARSYHSHHHFIESETAHGLTTSFWDIVFGTFPGESWNYSRRNPWTKWCHLPFPLLTFVLMSWFAGDTSKSVVKSSPTTTDPRAQARHGEPQRGYVIATFCSAMLVLFGWENLPM